MFIQFWTESELILQLLLMGAVISGLLNELLKKNNIRPAGTYLVLLMLVAIICVVGVYLILYFKISRKIVYSILLIMMMMLGLALQYKIVNDFDNRYDKIMNKN